MCAIRIYIKRFFSNYKIQVVILIVAASCIMLSLITYSSSDPSFNVITSKYPSNLLGYFGSHTSDILYQSFGVASLLIPLCLFSWSILLYKNGELKWLGMKIIMMSLSIISLSAALTNINISLSDCAKGAIGALILPLTSQYGLDSSLYFIIAALISFTLCIGIGFSCYRILIIETAAGPSRWRPPRRPGRQAGRRAGRAWWRG